MTDVMKIIREARKEQGISQERLANLAQVNPISISFWETYKFSPKFEMVENMLNELGMEIVIRKKKESQTEKEGHWTKTDVATYRCSECGKIQIADDVNELNYCCCCGSHNKVRRLKEADDIVKGEMRLVEDTTLWIKTNKWEQIGRVIVEDTNSVFGKVFYAEGTDNE